MKKMLLVTLMVFSSFGFSPYANADTYCTGTVTKINQYSSGDVFFYLGNSGSNDPAFKLASTTTDTKNRQVSFLLAAYTSGKRIEIHTASNINCSNVPYGTLVDMVLIEN